MTSRVVLYATLAAFTLASCMKKEGTTTDSSTNAKADSMKSAYKAFIAAWDEGKIDEFDKYISANSVNHTARPDQKQGVEGAKEYAKMMKIAYPDEKRTIEDMRVDGDNLIVRGRISGTNSGPWRGMPPTNKKITDILVLDWIRWENGKFVEHWGLADSQTLMAQLGLMPMPGTPPAGEVGKPMGKGMNKKKM